MDSSQFSQILQEGESALIEFKESLSDSLAKAIIAFANTAGGKIFIGVNDNNVVIGYHLSNKDKSHIQNIGNTCDPHVSLQVSSFVYDNKEVAMVEVPESRDKPVQCPDGFYLRRGSNSQKMSREEIFNYAQKTGKIRYESQLREDFNYPEDFDSFKFAEILGRMRITKTSPDNDILYNLGLGILNGKFVINNSGILFFGKNRQLYLRQAYVTCVLYKGTDKTLILDRKDFREDLVSDFENAFNFLRQHLRLEYEIKDAGPRKEIPEIPYEALRESLLNATIHRDYSEEGARIMVEIFDDRLEISNPGELLFDLSKLGRASIARNPIVFDIFNRLGLVEKVGSGISRIKNSMGERGLNVRFEIDSFFTVIFQRLPNKEIASINEFELTEKEMAILNSCSILPLSTKEISGRIGYSRLSTYHLISKLVENGFITYTIPDKPKSPGQRYKLTNKGLEYLNR